MSNEDIYKTALEAIIRHVEYALPIKPTNKQEVIGATSNKY